MSHRSNLFKESSCNRVLLSRWSFWSISERYLSTSLAFSSLDISLLIFVCFLKIRIGFKTQVINGWLLFHSTILAIHPFLLHFTTRTKTQVRPAARGNLKFLSKFIAWVFSPYDYRTRATEAFWDYIKRFFSPIILNNRFQTTVSPKGSAFNICLFTHVLLVTI